MTAPAIPLIPCVACGTLTRRRWCSLACLRAEDGDERERPASDTRDEEGE